MNRRAFLAGVGRVGVLGGIITLAGCTDILGGEEEEVDPTEESFQYFFNDETGTLGQAAEGNEPPEDAEEWQVIDNTLEESDWQQKQSNDVQVARDYLSGELDRRPDHQPVEGTVDQIVQRTQQIYENPEEALDPENYPEDELLLERLQQDDDPERFTRALIHATQTETELSSSAGSDNVVPNIAEYAINQLGLDFPEYRLSTGIAAEPSAGGRDGIREESIREREDGSTVGTTGMFHLMSLLTYEKNGDLQTRYVENVGAVKPSEFEQAIRPPEESEYRRPIDEGPFDVKGEKAWPEHYVTGFDYSKMKSMESEGLIEEGSIGRHILGNAMDMIDDGQNDRSFGTVHGCTGNEGYDVRVSDSFGQSVEDFVTGPTQEKKQSFENFSRAAYLVMEKELRENYKGEPVYGAEDPIRLEGTIHNPEFYHPQTPEC